MAASERQPGPCFGLPHRAPSPCASPRTPPHVHAAASPPPTSGRTLPATSQGGGATSGPRPHAGHQQHARTRASERTLSVDSSDSSADTSCSARCAVICSMDSRCSAAARWCLSCSSVASRTAAACSRLASVSDRCGGDTTKPSRQSRHTCGQPTTGVAWHGVAWRCVVWCSTYLERLRIQTHVPVHVTQLLPRRLGGARNDLGVAVEHHQPRRDRVQPRKQALNVCVGGGGGHTPHVSAAAAEHHHGRWGW